MREPSAGPGLAQVHPRLSATRAAHGWPSGRRGCRGDHDGHHHHGVAAEPLAANPNPTMLAREAATKIINAICAGIHSPTRCVIKTAAATAASVANPLTTTQKSGLWCALTSFHSSTKPEAACEMASETSITTTANGSSASAARTATQGACTISLLARGQYRGDIPERPRRLARSDLSQQVSRRSPAEMGPTGHYPTPCGTAVLATTHSHHEEPT